VDRVVLAFDNGTRVETEFLIAADGIRSVIRQGALWRRQPDL